MLSNKGKNKDLKELVEALTRLTGLGTFDYNAPGKFTKDEDREIYRLMKVLSKVSQGVLVDIEQLEEEIKSLEQKDRLKIKLDLKALRTKKVDNEAEISLRDQEIKLLEEELRDLDVSIREKKDDLRVIKASQKNTKKIINDFELTYPQLKE